MEDSINRTQENDTPSLLFSSRFLISIMLFFGVGVQYMQKIDMGIGIVCMVNNTAIKMPPYEMPFDIGYEKTSNVTCKFQPEHGNKTDGPFAWTKQVQGFVLSSYFYGYILTQVVSGWLSLKYGGRIVIAGSMLMGSLMTMLVSESARLGYGVLILTRFINGVAHGCVWPAISHLYTNWAPPLEKSRMIGFSGSGVNIGNIVALILGSYLCAHGFDGGWSSIFYVFGIIGIVWCALFMFLTAETPEEHKFISEREKIYVLANTGQRSQPGITSIRLSDTPWKSMFTSKPCLAIFITHFCSNWSNYLFLTQLPSYMKDILQFDIKSNGFLSTLPYIAHLSAATFSGFVGDKLIKSQKISTKNVRRIFNGLGFLLPFIAIIVLTGVQCDNPYFAVVLLTIGIGSFGLATGCGFLVNINEVGGKYTGMLFGLSNTFATIPGIIAPYIVGVITANKEQSEWKIVFWLTAVINLIGGAAYTFFCDTEPEHWALDQSDTSFLVPKEISEDEEVKKA